MIFFYNNAIIHSEFDFCAWYVLTNVVVELLSCDPSKYLTITISSSKKKIIVFDSIHFNC